MGLTGLKGSISLKSFKCSKRFKPVKPLELFKS